MGRDRHLRRARKALWAALAVWVVGAASGAVLLQEGTKEDWDAPNLIAGAAVGSVPALPVLLVALLLASMWLIERPRLWL